jgi:dolichol-phosphate mannosyltransferase
MKKKLISIGVPCFNEELNIFPCLRELSGVARLEKKYRFEFIFVDNGSTDSTRRQILKAREKDPRITAVFLSRNFGPEASGQAALDHSEGDAFLYYECDMQDPADRIPVFLRHWEQGNDIVVGVRTITEDSFVMTVLRKGFYALYKRIANIDVPVNAGSFGLMDRRVVTALKQLPEKYRFFRGLRSWVGFRTAYIPYNRKKRKFGRSSYSLMDYFRHAERSFFGFSYMPLDIMVYSGFGLVFFSFLFLSAYLLYRLFFYPGPITDLPIILTAILFFGGLQLIGISFVGKYVQVIVEETKNRPVYIVSEVYQSES